jgi:bifunctional enzyme CysN/CysC
MDYALLLDGLDAEREQGITIDVAYRYFSTDRRSFIVADCPGHEQYTRNMATGASTADLADRAGRRAQGPADADAPAQLHRRAVRHPPRRAGGQQDGPGRLSREVFDADRRGLPRLAATLGIARVTPSRCRPEGRQRVARSAAMPWYTGPALLESSTRSSWRDGAGRRPSACRCSGSAALAGLPRLRRQVVAGSVRVATRSPALPRAALAGEVDRDRRARRRRRREGQASC